MTEAYLLVFLTCFDILDVNVYCSDLIFSQVARVDLEEVLSQGAYMLLYSRYV